MMKLSFMLFGKFLKLVSFNKIDPDAILRRRTQRIREFMLSQLQLKQSENRDFYALKRRIIFAADAVDLWYLRSDWVLAISKASNGVHALSALKELDMMLLEYIPRSMHPRKNRQPCIPIADEE